MDILRFIRFIFIALIGAIIITFALSNRAAVSVSFFPFDYEVELPLFLLLFVSFIVGIAIGGFSSVLHNLRLRHMSRSAQKQVSKLSKELDVLKTRTELPE